MSRAGRAHRRADSPCRVAGVGAGEHRAAQWPAGVDREPAARQPVPVGRCVVLPPPRTWQRPGAFPRRCGRAVWPHSCRRCLAVLGVGCAVAVGVHGCRCVAGGVPGTRGACAVGAPATSRVWLSCPPCCCCCCCCCLRTPPGAWAWAGCWQWCRHLTLADAPAWQAVGLVVDITTAVAAAVVVVVVSSVGLAGFWRRSEPQPSPRNGQQPNTHAA